MRDTRLAMHRGAFVAVCLALGLSLSAQAADRELEERGKQLIVMINGDLDGAPTLGAGIIVGVGSERLYIATANHVVRRGTRAAESLRVELKSMPGESLPARVLEDNDPGLDLAVLVVTGVSRWRIPVAELPFDSLGNAGRVVRGDEVFHVGFPNGTAWRVNVAPDHISESFGNTLMFESSSIGPGNSGGGLFNEHWQLIGMVRADQPPDAEAVRVDRILETLERWGYPVGLRQATLARPEAPPELTPKQILATREPGTEAAAAARPPADSTGQPVSPAAASVPSPSPSRMKVAIFPFRSIVNCYYPVGERVIEAVNDFAARNPSVDVAYSWYDEGAAPLPSINALWTDNAVNREPRIDAIAAAGHKLDVSAVVMAWYRCNTNQYNSEDTYDVEVYLVDLGRGNQIYRAEENVLDSAKATRRVLAQFLTANGVAVR